MKVVLHTHLFSLFRSLTPSSRSLGICWYIRCSHVAPYLLPSTFVQEDCLTERRKQRKFGYGIECSSGKSACRGTSPSCRMVLVFSAESCSVALFVAWDWYGCYPIRECCPQDQGYLIFKENCRFK